MRLGIGVPGSQRFGHRTLVGAGLVGAGSLLSGAAFVAAGEPSLRPWPVLGLWVLSIGFVLAGALLVERRKPLWRPDPPFSQREIRLLMLLTASAVLVRAIALESVPDNFGGDEGETGEYARLALRGDLEDPFSTGWAGHPTVWFFLQAASLAVFGDSVFGLRMLSALLGAAAVPALYLFARPAFGRAVAGVAAVLLTALHLHVHYSRVGLNSVADALLMLLAVGLLLAGLRRGSPLAYAGAGVAAGVGQHFYLGSRLVPLVLLGIVVQQLLFDRRNVAAGRYLVLTTVAFWVGYGPGLRVPLFHWNDFNARLAQVGVFQSGWYEQRRELGDSVLDIFVHQTTRAAGAFTHVADRSADYWPQMPMLDSVSAVFFVAGLLLVARRWRRAESAALLVWLGGTVTTGGILLVDSPQSHRYVGATPAACLLVALAIVRLQPAVAAIAPRARPVLPVVAGMLVAGIAVWNLNFYFREYSPRHHYGFRQGEEITLIGRYLDRQARDSFVYFLGAPYTYYSVGTIRFLAAGVPGTDVIEPLRRSADVPALPADRRSVFVVLPGRMGELGVIRRTFPRGTLRTFVSKADGQPLFTVYEPESSATGAAAVAAS